MFILVWNIQNKILILTLKFWTCHDIIMVCDSRTSNPWCTRKIHSNLQYYSYKNLPMYSKLEQKTGHKHHTYIQIQVVISVGWVLETGTDPQRLSGRFLRFITTSFKKPKTWFWYITKVLNFFWKKNQITSQKNCLFFFTSFMKIAIFCRFFKIGKVRQTILWFF
jgi:hypothetical protein